MEGLEELPCVQPWEEGFLQGVGELFPSAPNSLLMTWPLQGVEINLPWLTSTWETPTILLPSSVYI